MKIAILNASNPLTNHLESDQYTDFRSGREQCFNDEKCIKQCRSWHFWAYSLETEFFVHGKENWTDVFKYDAVILLVNRDISSLISLVKKLKLMKKKVGVSFHEGVGDLINNSGLPNENPVERWTSLYNLVQEADFYINIFSQMQKFFEGWFGENKVKFCPHGAPIDWTGLNKYILPYEDRPYDILIGTRTLGQRLCRNTLITLGVANSFAKEGKSVHYISEDGDVSEIFKKMGFNNIVVHVGAKSWEEWLKFIAQFKVVVHSDQSLNMGQIFMDCAMMNVSCVGSTTHFAFQEGVEDMNDSGLLHHLIKNYKKQPSDFIKKEIHPNRIREQIKELWK